MLENLIDKLKTLGFNSYEAKVYLALLRNHPATGYEVSKASNVPQARAYDTLKTLEARKTVVAVGIKPVTYIPVHPNHLLDDWERSFQGSIDYLRTTLPTLANETAAPILNLQGREAVLPYALNMINQAQHSVVVAFCKIDAALLYQPLQEAQERGVNISLLSYDPCDMPGLKVYFHASFLHLLHRNPWLILSVDDNEGLASMRIQKELPPQAIVTRTRAVVRLITELVLHGIFLAALEERLSPDMEQIYGKDMGVLREEMLTLQKGILKIT